MKQRKSKGALIVSLLLAAVLIGVYAGTAIKLGVTIYRAARGETSMDAVQPMPEDPDSIAFEDELPAETPVQPNEALYPEYVEFEAITGDDYNMYAEVTGHFADGSTWQYFSQAYPVTELDPVTEIGTFEDAYYFCAGGEVIALDLSTGAEKWIDGSFGGYSPVWQINEEGMLVLSGFYGPDVHVIDQSGSVIAHAEMLDENYMWPMQVSFAGENMVKIVFSIGPDGDGEYTLVYNIQTGEVTDTNQSHTELYEEPAWMGTYRELLNGEAGSIYDSFALIYVDSDDIPELYARQREKGMLFFIHSNGSVGQQEINSYEFGYFARTGLFMEARYEDDRNEETYYTLKNGQVQPLGTGKVNYADEMDPAFWWNDKKVSDSEYYENMREFMSDSGRSYYPTSYPKQMLLAQLDCWFNPSENIYWNWKEEFLSNVRQEMEQDARFALIDVDENGVPEMFIKVQEEEYSYMRMCHFNEQTQQCIYWGLSEDLVKYIPGTDTVTDGYIYNNHISDTVYLVNGEGVWEVAYGSRENFENEDVRCYFRGDQISLEGYMLEMAPVFDENAVLIDDVLVSAEEIIKQLK